MLNLPFFTLAVIDPFAQAMWSETTWARAQEMVAGVLLTTGKRTVSSVLRVMDLGTKRSELRTLSCDAESSGIVGDGSEPDFAALFGKNRVLKNRRFK